MSVTSGELEPLILTCPNTLDQAHDAVCQALLADDRLQSGVSLEVAQVLLRQTPGLKALVLFETPLDFLNRRMAQYESLSQALAAWQADALGLMAMVRQFRRRTLLIERAMITAYPDVFTTQHGFEQATGKGLALLRPAPPDPMLGVLADYIRMQAPETRKLVAEMQASAIDLSNGAPQAGIGADDAFHTYQKLQAEAEALRSQMADSNARFEEAERFLRRKSDNLTAEMRALQQQVDAKDGQIDQLQEQMSQTQARLQQQAAEAQARQSTLMQQVQQAQDDVQARHADLRKMEDTVQSQRRKTATAHARVLEMTAEKNRQAAVKNQLREQLSYTEAQLQAVLSSRTYRMVARLGKLKSLFKR